MGKDLPFTFLSLIVGQINDYNYTYKIQPADEANDLLVFVVRQHLYRCEAHGHGERPGRIQYRPALHAIL